MINHETVACARKLTAALGPIDICGQSRCEEIGKTPKKSAPRWSLYPDPRRVSEKRAVPIEIKAIETS